MTDLLADLQYALPVSFGPFDPKQVRTGLVVVDIVNGFASVGAGALAPPVPDARIGQMIAEADRLGRNFADRGWPVLAFQDSHRPGQPEPPYPPHCEQGSGEDELVPALSWMGDHPAVTCLRKDCINGFVGAMDLATGRNRMTDWVRDHRLEAVLVLGICTDICVMDFVLTVLSARNHGVLTPLETVAVYEPGCATYDLPRDVAEHLGLPPQAAHPRSLTHHAGLYFMASRGAFLVNEVQGE